MQTEVAAVDTNEIARRLGCSSRNVYKMLNEGRLPESFMVGTLRRWLRSDIDLWLNNGCPDRETFAQIKAKQS